MEVLQGADWGDVPTWVTGFATLIAVIVALVQASRAQRATREEAAAREAARVDELAGQARLLSVTRSTRSSAGVVFQITNHSDAPFFSVQVEAAYFDTLHAPASYTWGLSKALTGQGLSRTVLGPGESHRTGIEFRDPDGGVLNAIGGDHALDVSYVDAHGVRWRRYGNALPRRDEQYPAVHRDPTFVPARHQNTSGRRSA